MNFIIRKPTSAAGDASALDAAAEGGGLAGATSPGSQRIKSLRLSNVPIGEALKYICEAAKLRYKVDDYAVTLMPKSEVDTEIFTRTFRVPPNFRDVLDASAGGQPGGSQKKPILELLKRCGIVFGPGGSAILTPNGLLITNTVGELDKIEQLVSSMHSAGPADNDDVLPPLLDDISPPAPAQAAGFENSDGSDRSGLRK